MTASQWFRDAFLIYENAPDKDEQAARIIHELVQTRPDGLALEGFLTHLQAELRSVTQQFEEAEGELTTP